MIAGSFRNTVLQHLDPDTLGRLQLRRVQLPLRYSLEVAGKTIDHLFFLEEGIGSMTTCFENGAQVETSMFGYESVVGVSALMGTKHSLNSIFMQSAGFGYLSPVKAAPQKSHPKGRFQP